MAEEMRRKEISLWWIHLDRYAELPGLLSDAEWQRADRFVQDADRCRFIAARKAMRTILASYLCAAAESLIFETTDSGKPYLTNYPEVQFNITHSEALAGFAVWNHGPLGIDCERLSHLKDCEIPWTRICSQEELKVAARFTPSQRLDLFYKIWTRKEATLKAIGTGLRFPPGSFSVLSNDDHMGVSIPGHGRLWPSDLDAPRGYVAACCTYAGLVSTKVTYLGFGP